MTSVLDWSLDDVSLKKQLLGLSKPKLIKICKSNHVSHNGNKKDIIRRLMQKNKQNPIEKNSKSHHKKSHSKMKIKKQSSAAIKPIPIITEIKIDEMKENETKHNQMKNHKNHKNKNKKKHKNKKRSKKMQVKIDKMKKKKHGSYIWILDKNRKLRHVPSPVPIASIQKRKLSLTNGHNFLWITSILKGSISFAEKESELTKASFDRMLSLLPKNYRLKIWEIINIDNDIFVMCEDYVAFVDCLLVATGQKYEMEEDMDCEIRDMSKIFAKIINIDNIFKHKKYISNSVSKSKMALSVVGAKKIISNLRNLKENEINIDILNDLALPILTGLTKKALIFSVTYCTQTYWKILTDIFWDEENEKDLALCTPIDHFNSVVKATSIHDLFGELYCEVSYDLCQISEDTQNDEVPQNDLDIQKYLSV